MNCPVSNQIAELANTGEEAECEKCQSEMTVSVEGCYGILICDECGHKVWADGDEY